MESEQDQRLKLALAITKAINNEEFSSIKTFMEKFYKRSLSEKNKINEIRLTRFNALLYKVNNQFSQLHLDDLKIIVNVLFCFITKISGFLNINQKIRLFTATYYWTGQLLVSLSNSKLGIQFAYQILNWCLKDKQLKFPKLQQFQQNLQKSPYFNQIHLNQEQESKGNQVKIKDFIIQQQEPSYSILKSTNIESLLQGLITNSDKLTNAFDYFLLFSKKDGLIQGSKFKSFNKLFIQNFNSQRKLTIEYTKFLKYSIQKGQFCFSNQQVIEREINRVNKLIIEENRKKMDQNIANGMIIQQTTVDPIFCLPDISKEPVEILINNFVSSPNPSFKQLYAILKSNQPISKVVWKYFLETVPLNNAKGIILSLMIVQSKKGIANDLLKFYQGIQNPKQDQKIGMMFILHLALQQHPIECDLITNIIDIVKENQLLDVCKFGFLPQQPIQKLKTTKQEKTQIQELLNTKFEHNEKLQHMFKVKIDLTSLIGDNVPFLNALQKVNQITSKSLEQIIQYLPLERSQQILEVVLMRVNHLMKHKYVQEVSDKVLDWVTKSFANYYTKFGKLIKEFLSSIKKQNYLQLIISLKMHNLSRDSVQTTSMLSIPQFTNLFQRDPFLKLKGEEYSSYLIHAQNITSYQSQCDRIWNHMNELIKFIRLIDEKNHSKKEVKKLLDKISYPTIYIVQSIYYSMKNNILNKELISKMISLFETHYEVFEIAETKAAQLDLQYYQIDQLFDYLLSISYEETVNFICALLKNNGIIKEQKASKAKKGGNKKGTKSQISSQLQPNKIIKSLITCFPILLNQPNRLKDLSKITQIVERLMHYVTKTEEKDFINCIICWAVQFDTLTYNSFSQMLSRAKSLKQFWIKVHPMLKGNLNNKQIEDQFKYFSNLLTRSKIYIAQQNYDTLQHQLLSILQLIFSLQNIRNGTKIRSVQPENIYSIFEANKKKPQDGNYFFCEDCDKNICEGCYHFMHRNHDVNFIIKQKGHCAHQLQDKRNKPSNNNNSLNPSFGGNPNELARKPHKFIQKFANYSNFQDLDQLMRQELNVDLHFEKMALIQKAMKQKKEKFFEHIIQREREHSFVFGRDNPLSYEISYSQPNPPISNINNIFQPAAIQSITDSIPVNVKQKQEKSQQQFEIKSQTQKSIVEINTKQNNYISNIVFLSETQSLQEAPAIHIDMNDLLKELINDIPNTKVVGAEDDNDGLTHCLEKFNFEINPKLNIELGQDKYTMMRVNISRLGGARYDLIDGDQRGDRKFKVNTNLRMFVTSNQKIIAIAHGSSITFIQQQPLRKIFKKREKARKFNDVDNQDTYRFQKKMDVPFQILDISFSKISPNYLCVLNTNQINIINTTNNSHRDYKKFVYSFQNDGDTTSSAVRFSWLPFESNKIVIQIGTSLKIFQFKQQQFSSNRPLNLIKNIVVNRTIDSYQIRFCTVINTYCCFIVDTQGQIFTEKFKLARQQLEQFKLNLPDHKDKLNCLMISEKSDVGFVSFKDGSNIFMKIQDTKIISHLNFKFSKLQNMTNQSQEILNRFGHCIYCVKQIYSSKQIVVLGCILRKQINGQSSGNFAIIEIFGQNNLNFCIMNDGFKTQNFEVINFEDDGNRNKFILTGIQTDGYLWMKTYQVKKFNNRSNNLDNLIDDKIEIHNKQIINILNLQFGQQRTLEFKEDLKLQSLELNSSTNINSLNLPLIKASCFITGISLRVEAVGKIKIKIFDSVFEFNVKKPRQLQIPLSLKQSILSYIHKKIVLQITDVSYLNGTLQLFGTTFDKQSQLKQIYKQLVYVSSFDINYDSTDISHYFNNSSRFDFNSVSLDNMLTTLKKENLDLHEINFVIKLELLVQAIEKGSIILNTHILEQFIDKSKKYIWIDRPCISTSIQRMFKKIFGIYKKLSLNSGKSIMLGDPYDYHTFRDTLITEKYYKQFLSNLCHSTFDQLVNSLIKMRIRKICNLYLMFALFPTLIWRLTNYYTVELQKITADINKKKIGDRLVSMIALICEYFEYLKNKNKSGEKQTFKLMEMLLSGISKNKQLFKELIMRSFEYLETVPLKKQIDINYGCKLFSIAVPIQMQEQHHHAEILSQVFEEQKQSEQQQAEMQIDEDYESIILVPERTLSAQFIHNITKQFKVDDGTRILRQNRQTAEFKITYYDIVYHLVVGLFEDNVIKSQTNNFYIGLSFNLLNLLDIRIFKYDLKYNMIQLWLDTLNRQLTNKQASALFLVLSHFLEPNYSKFNDNNNNEQTPKIRDLIVEYYFKNPNKLPFKQLFSTYISSDIEKTIKLKEALSSNDIICNSIVYQLKYLGNLYLNLIANKMDTKKLDPQIREFILKIYVKKRLRVYRNIIILEGWMDDLEEMKYCVAFESIHHGDIDIGLGRLLDTIKEKPQTLVQFLKKNENYLQALEDLLDRDIQLQHKSQIIEIVNEYYSRA